jgi:hypothetical protein
MSSDTQRPTSVPLTSNSSSTTLLSEDDIKRQLQVWLEAMGWQAQVIWGHGRGIDIEARRSGQRWVIEVKGSGSLNRMRVNYFLTILGELLQRMTDPSTRYSIALPDMKQFRGLWQRLAGTARCQRRLIECVADAEWLRDLFEDPRAV